MNLTSFWLKGWLKTAHQLWTEKNLSFEIKGGLALLPPELLPSSLSLRVSQNKGSEVRLGLAGVSWIFTAHIKAVWGRGYLSDQVILIDLSAWHSCVRTTIYLVLECNFTGCITTALRQKINMKIYFYLFQNTENQTVYLRCNVRVCDWYHVAVKWTHLDGYNWQASTIENVVHAENKWGTYNNIFECFERFSPRDFKSISMHNLRNEIKQKGGTV